MVRGTRKLNVTPEPNHTLEACASVLFVYDWMVHFSLEVNHIWRSASPVSALQVLYILQRYLPFFDTVLLKPFCKSMRLFY